MYIIFGLLENENTADQCVFSARRAFFFLADLTIARIRITIAEMTSARMEAAIHSASKAPITKSAMIILKPHFQEFYIYYSTT